MKAQHIFLLLFTALLLYCGLTDKNSVWAEMPGQQNILQIEGVRADGQALNTDPLQRAIDGLSAAGGGTLVFPAGTYLTGTLRLKDNITLHLEPGAVLRGSPELKDYPGIDVSFPTMNNLFYRHALLYAENAVNIGITGSGIIDGQGDARGFRRQSSKAPDRYMNRPSILRFVNCTGVRMRDVRIKDAGFWVTHFLACDDMVLDGITIESRTANYNNDGIDIDCCSNVRVSNCHIDSQDDAICLKSTGQRICRNVVITNCVISSNCSGIRFGCEAFGGFEDIVISNITMNNIGASAIQLQTFDGGILDRVSLSGITMHNVNQAIFINVGHEMYPIGVAEADLPLQHPETIGKVRNIILRDIQADGVGRCARREVGGKEYTAENKYACILSGMPESRLENITMNAIRLRCVGNGTAEDAASDLAEVPNGFNAGSMGMTPAYGVYCRNVDNLRLRDIEVSCENDDLRPAVMLEKCSDVDVFNVDGKAHPAAVAFMRLRNVDNTFLHGCHPAGLHAFLSVEGADTAAIRLIANDFRKTATPVVIAPNTPPSAVTLERQDWVPMVGG